MANLMRDDADHHIRVFGFENETGVEINILSIGDKSIQRLVVDKCNADRVRV